MKTKLVSISKTIKSKTVFFQANFFTRRAFYNLFLNSSFLYSSSILFVILVRRQFSGRSGCGLKARAVWPSSRWEQYLAVTSEQDYVSSLI